MFKKRPYPMRSHYLMVDKRASTDDQVVIRHAALTRADGDAVAQLRNEFSVVPLLSVDC